MLCPYDAERLDAELLAGAQRTHPQLIDADGHGDEDMGATYWFSAPDE